MANWRDGLRKVTHPPAFAAFAVDLGPITITVDGDERDLIGGSFRGVSFFVDVSVREGGRRGVNHLYPGSPDNYVDDLGRDYRSYKVEAYVIGGGYLDQRDKLIDALEDKDELGPGQLIHPYYGEKLVALMPGSRFSVTESKADGGWAKFSMTFVETPTDPPFPLISISLPSLLGAILGAIAALIVAAAALALAVVLAILTVRALVRAVENFCSDLASLASLFDFDDDDAAVFAVEVDVILGRADQYARHPDELITDASAALDLLKGVNQGDLMNGLLDVYAFDTGAAPPRQADHFHAFVAGMKRLVLVHATRAAGGTAFDSQAAAVAARARIGDLLDEQDRTATPDVYDALMKMRAELAKTVPAQGADLPQVVAYTPRTTTNSLVLSYRLYGTTDLAGDIVKRNGIRHPGFIVGVDPQGIEGGGAGQDGVLEVLSRGGPARFSGG